MINIDSFTFIILLIAFFITILLTALIFKKTSKSQLKISFLCMLSCLLICQIGLIAQILFSNKYNIKPVYFDYFVYIGTVFLPVCVLSTGIIFGNTKVKFKKSYLLLLVIPLITLIVLWTNDFHHLFFEEYSLYINEMVYGKYLIVNSVYSYILLFIGIFFLVKYSIKNSGFFSRQSILIALGCICPVVINVLGTFRIISMTIYMTPISFTMSVACFALAIFKFDFLKVAPIALQRIVDRMSDSYIVLDEKNVITDFNQSFLRIFKEKEKNIRNTNIFSWNKIRYFENLEQVLQSVSINSKTISFETYVDSIDKYFNVEVSSIVNKNAFLGSLILFKDITQHEKDMKTIKDNQDMLVERERFASLRSNDWWYCP